jgi:hypothetical protein
MSMPGFAAEASLFKGSSSYYGSVRASRVGAAIVPQQDSGCTVSCLDWVGCNNKCGSWPPGLSNYGCWLDCLAPSINCLQGTCYQPPPAGCCPRDPWGREYTCCGSCETGKCDDVCVPPGLECP